MHISDLVEQPNSNNVLSIKQNKNQRKITKQKKRKVMKQIKLTYYDYVHMHVCIYMHKSIFYCNIFVVKEMKSFKY